VGYYLAIDIGEKVGYHILGHLEKDKLQLEEIHRFENVFLDYEGEKCWDLLQLFDEIKTGIKKCRELDKLPIFIGIDTLITDFVLLDDEDKVIGNTLANSQNSNTKQQLITIKDKHPDYLKKAKALLMFPDFFNFLLTGIKLCEFTIAGTTQLVRQGNQEWDKELIESFGYSRDIFQEIRRPGTVLGTLTREVTEEVGYDCIVVLPATHAASSAIFALDSKKSANLLELGSFVRASGSDAEYSTAAIGNLLVQLIISHELKDVQAAHECVQNSFDLSKYEIS
jgi:rhamnulokinase